MKNNRMFFRRFALRFTISHVITYTLFGIAFMFLSDYFRVFNEHELMSTVMRPSNSIWVRLAVPFQILRGFLLSLAIYPIREGFINNKYGWIKLFVLMWVLTGIGSVITGPGSIEGFLYTKLGFGNPLVGIPEITLQMLAFSYFFTKWLHYEKV